MRQPRRIEQKWGFGMAPIKTAVQKERVEAARTVLSTLAGGRHAALGRLDDLSTVKGLFTRTYKQDQWDWFTVWEQLGFLKGQLPVMSPVHCYISTGASGMLTP
jgi:hypothetical protein